MLGKTASQSAWNAQVVLLVWLYAAVPLCMAGGTCGNLRVHEWGTFTTLTSSSGTALSGTYFDASPLPDFVYGLPYFNSPSDRGWADFDHLRQVTVKMETPVLYFYADAQTEVHVAVDFLGGTISQWYPQRSAGEANPTAPFVNFGQNPYRGRIEWNATVLAPNDLRPYTPPEEKLTHEWRAPRNTASNRILGSSGEVEKYLFYRGIGGFQSALSARFDAQGRLQIANAGDEAIAYVMVYEKDWMEQSAAPPRIWWEGSLTAGGKIKLSRPEGVPSHTQASQAIERFHQALVDAGLFEDEAQAMLDTWHDSYFQVEKGLKVFWILPHSQVDSILPLHISPTPRHTERVMVGRSDILTPEFEAKLLADHAAGNFFSIYLGHKYRLGFEEFIRRKKNGTLMPNAVTSIQPSGRFSRNHANLFRFELRQGVPVFRIADPDKVDYSGAMDIRGRQVLHLPENGPHPR